MYLLVESGFKVFLINNRSAIVTYLIKNISNMKIAYERQAEAINNNKPISPKLNLMKLRI